MKYGKDRKPYTRLSHADVDEIRRLRDSAGYTFEELGKRFGVSDTAAKDATRRYPRIHVAPRTWTGKTKLRGDVIEHRLYHHGKYRATVKLDAEDGALLSKSNWRISHLGYAVTNVKGVPYEMQRLVVSPRPGCQVRHQNRDKLDNRKCNLRFVNRRALADVRERKEKPSTTS